MNRSTTTRASLSFLLCLLALVGNTTPTLAQATPAESAPTATPAPAAPNGVEPVLITAGESAPATTATPAAAPSPTPLTVEAPEPVTSPTPATPSLVTPAAAPRPAVAEDLDPEDARSCLSLFGVIDHRWNTSDGFDLFSDNNVTQHYGLALAYDLATLTDQLTLALEVGWNTGSSHREALLGGDLTRTELTTHSVIAAAVARYDLWPWLAPHARMSLGMSFVDMSLATTQDSTFKDNTSAPLLGLGIGASIQTPPRKLATRSGGFASLQIGLRLELGYTLMGDAAFSLHADDDLRVPVTDSSTGGLSRSGPYIQSAVFARL